MKIFIKTLEGKHEINVSPEYSISNLKDEIYEVMKIRPEQQRLIFNGYPMINEYTLEKQKVEEGSIIHLLLNMM
jgi:hypothetical protein